jgi:chromosome segregation ATPase
MSKASPLFLAIILFTSAGLYGCTQQKGAPTAKLRDMEARFTKLEEDFRAVVATAEVNRKKLAQAEAEKAELTREVEELRPVVQERDDLKKEREDLRKQLAARTSERDNIQTQLTQFRQELQNLISRVDGALSTPTRPGTPLTALPASRRSQ